MGLMGIAQVAMWAKATTWAEAKLQAQAGASMEAILSLQEWGLFQALRQDRGYRRREESVKRSRVELFACSDCEGGCERQQELMA